MRRRLVRVSDGPLRRPCRPRQVALLGVETSFGSSSRHFGGVKLRSNAQLGRYGRTLRGGNVGFREASPLLRREARGAEMVAGLLCRPRLRARSRPGDRGAFFGRCEGRSRRGGSEIVGELGWRVVRHDDGRVVARGQRSWSRAFGHGEDDSLVVRSSGFGFGWGQAGWVPSAWRPRTSNKRTVAAELSFGTVKPQTGKPPFGVVSDTAKWRRTQVGALSGGPGAG